MIIVEGTDLVGKTTFCRKLLEHPSLKGAAYWYHHMGRPPKGFDECQGYMDLAYMNSVQDRFHMGAPVYSKVRGDEESPCTPEKYRLVDAHLRMMGSITVIILSDEDTIRTRYAMLGSNELYSADQVVLANEIYKGIVSTGGYMEYWTNRIYKMDWDIAVTPNPGDYPNQKDVQNTISIYMKRQAQIQFALGSKGAGPAF